MARRPKRNARLSVAEVTPALRDKTKDRRGELARLSQAGAVRVGTRNDLLPYLQHVQRDPRALLPPARNARKVDAAHVREVANSIEVFGFTRPVLIDGDGGVIDGWVTIEAAKLVRLPTIPCVMVEHLSATELKLLRIALNRLGEKGAWDLDELKLELEELIIDDAPIEVSGFTGSEIDLILLADEVQPVETGPLGPGPNARAVACEADVFIMGPHRLVCGNATERRVLDILMAGKPARLVFTDQPYNVRIAGHVTGGQHREFAMASGEMSDEQFAAFNAAWIEAASDHLVDGGVLMTFIDWRGLGSVSSAALVLGLAQLNLIVWQKTNAGMGSLYRSQHELLPIFKKGSAPHVNNVDLGRKGRWRSNVWVYPGASTVGSDARQGLQHHPTVKPTAMLEDALLDLTCRGDIVLDPFLGSGSTLIAAEKTGRICYGVEIDPLYVDVIARRFAAVTGQHAVLEATGQTFAELSAERLAVTVAVAG